MNSKRSTPQSKSQSRGPSSASKFRTPTNANTTTLERRGTGTKPRTGSKSVRSQSCLDLTGVTNLTGCPSIKGSLLNLAEPQIDYELECDFATSDHLQALVKQEIISQLCSSYEEDVSDQLAIQKDNLHKSKLMLRKLNRELADLEMSGLIDGLLDAMEKNLDAFVESSQNLDLTRTLEQLSEIFEMVSKKVALQNVHKVTDRGSFDKLESSLHKCAEICARILELEENTTAVVNLADLVKKYEETRRSALQKQKLIDTVQRNETHRLFKFLSEMYAEREKYANFA
ncbi:hypothetical protein MTP99_011644 [Tenebrio molitor]|jgi:hypothetical protein|nr:hypothetical protein MTP99_011644 [Tenebrio molitor]